jgi:hypothetical protein
LLRKLYLKNQAIPVPIPINTFAEAIRWIESDLLKPNHVITSINLDGVEIDIDSGDRERGFMPLTEKSRLCVKIETPKELALQAIDAACGLATVINSRLKPLAVKCWQLGRNEIPADMKHISSDLELIYQLVEHTMGFVDASHVDTAPIQGIVILLKKVHKALQDAYFKSDWRLYARLLLNRLEPLILDFILEAEGLQLRVFAIDEDHGNGGWSSASPSSA